MPAGRLRILVAGSRESLVRFASTLATLHDGEIHIANAKGAKLQKAQKFASSLGVEAFAHKTGDVPEIVRRTRCNMIVLDSPDIGLIHQVDVEALILTERGTSTSPGRILAPTSGGGHSLMGIQLAHELGETWNVGLEVIRVARDAECDPDDPVLRKYCDQLREDTRVQMKVMGIDAPVTILPAVDVVEPILSRAEKGDLIVLGVSNEWRQENFTAGSVPDEILNKAPCSVLMVRAPTGADIQLSGICWEQTVRLNMRPKDKWDAIRQLIGALVEEKQVPASQKQAVLDTVMDRERQAATAIGLGTAVPHAPIPKLPGIIGCLGICPDGVDYEGAHDELVKFIFLLLTPSRNYRSYLPVLAQIATLIKSEEFRTGLLGCQTPSEVTALIKAQERLA